MKIVIVEDEAAAARRLQKLVEEISPETECMARLDSIEDTINWIDHHDPPDLFFFDIHLADGSCFEIFNHVQIERPVIFTTAYDQYAIQAFKVNALDYLLKPIKKAELETALEKFRRWDSRTKVDYEKLSRALHPEKTPTRFLIRFGQNLRLVSSKDAAYFYTEDRITFVITHEGKRYPLDYTLDKLDEMLDDHVFFRINRQFIIHVDAIDEMHAYSKSRVKIDLKPPCDLDTVVSTERSPHFKRWLVGE